MNRALQAVATRPEQAHRDTDVAHQARELAIRLAASGAPLSAKELALIFRITPSQFHRRERDGAFDFLKLVPAIGPKHYSGVKVTRYLSGHPVYEPSFGR